MFSVGRSEFVPCLPGRTSLPPVIRPQVLQCQWFAQSTWGTRRGCAWAAPSTQGADEDAQSQKVNVLSGLLTEWGRPRTHTGPPRDWPHTVWLAAKAPINSEFRAGGPPGDK